MVVPEVVYEEDVTVARLVELEVEEVLTATEVAGQEAVQAEVG